MKIQCELCHELVTVTEFRASASGIEVDCPACGGAECPKCGAAVRDGAEACARCGLLVDRFDGYRDPALEDAPDALVALWPAVEAGWADDAAHERFVQSAMALGAYSYAAAKYREAQRARSGGPDDGRAAHWLAEISRRVEAALLEPAAIRRSATDRRPRVTQVLMIVLVTAALLGAGIVVMLYFQNQRATHDMAPERTPAPARTSTPGGR